MRICILCEDSKVELARENSKGLTSGQEVDKKVLHPKLTQIKENLGILGETTHLRVPVSPTGELPVTHWFCFMNVTESGYSKVKSLQEHSIIEEASPKEFLSKWNLQIIK